MDGSEFPPAEQGKAEISVVGANAHRQLVCEYLESRSFKTGDQIKN